MIQNKEVGLDFRPRQYYDYLLDIFHRLYLQLPQKRRFKGNVMYALIQSNLKNQSNIQDISVKNVMLGYV
jgi:hypothetical protein